MTDVKSGNTTSEHKKEWRSTLISLATVLIPFVMDLIGHGSPYYIGLAAVLAGFVKASSMGYTKARSMVKVAASDAAAIVNPLSGPPNS